MWKVTFTMWHVTSTMGQVTFTKWWVTFTMWQVTFMIWLVDTITWHVVAEQLDSIPAFAFPESSYKNLLEDVAKCKMAFEKEMTNMCEVILSWRQSDHCLSRPIISLNTALFFLWQMFQTLDEKRIDHMRDHLWKCTNVDSRTCVEQDQVLILWCSINQFFKPMSTLGPGNRIPIALKKTKKKTKKTKTTT